MSARPIDRLERLDPSDSVLTKGQAAQIVNVLMLFNVRWVIERRITSDSSDASASPSPRWNSRLPPFPQLWFFSRGTVEVESTDGSPKRMLRTARWRELGDDFANSRSNDSGN